MTNASWQKILLLFEESEKVVKGMHPLEPTPEAKVCNESAHFTLGHLTSCQSAWLPLIRALQNGETNGSIPINPNPLFTKLGYERAPWETLVERFVADRAEWRRILEQVDLNHELLTSKRIWSAQTLTKRMVEHERNHLNVHSEAKSARDTGAQTGKSKL